MGPPRFLAWQGTRHPRVSSLDDPPLPGQVHAQVCGGGVGKGKEGRAQLRCRFLGATVLFFSLRGLFIYFWGPVNPPRVPIRSVPQPSPSGQVPWEEGRETLTGPFSKATKVLSVPTPKPAEPALQKFIQQVRLPAGAQAVRVSRRPSAAALLQPAGPRLVPVSRELSWSVGSGTVAAGDRVGESQAAFNFPGGWGGSTPSLVSTPGGCPRPHCMKPGQGLR